jgi:hypothetical protein
VLEQVAHPDLVGALRLRPRLMTPARPAVAVLAILLAGAACAAPGDADLVLRHRPRSAQDDLAPAIVATLESTPLGKHISDPGSSRYLRTVDGRDYYYVDGRESRLCLLYVQRPDDLVAATCNSTEALNGIGIYLAESDLAGQPPRVSLLVPDSFTHATNGPQAQAVESNLVVFERLTGTRIELAGPGDKRHTIDIGTLVPKPGK